jgi:galactonate dehydratase
MPLRRIAPLVLNVSAKTNWIFIEIATDEGLTGWGEATLTGVEPLVCEAVRMQASALIGTAVDDALARIEPVPLAPGGLAWNAAASAIEQALVDLAAQARGVAIHRWLRDTDRQRVPVYANINRATTDRSPEGCAASAQVAVAQGFRAVKIAPFDGVLPRDCAAGTARARVEEGLARVAAMRTAIGADVELMVDCHWRFDAATATSVLFELDRLGVRWYECPVSERPGWWPVLKRLRGLANERGMRLAGAETQIGLMSFRALFDAGVYDVVMPDVKYAGGYREMLRIAELAERHKVAFAPHNPSGPVCNLASLHVCGAASAVERLEYQLGESVLFFDIVDGVGPRLAEGTFLLPDNPGLGATVSTALFAEHPYAPVPIAPDPRLG